MPWSFNVIHCKKRQTLTFTGESLTSSVVSDHTNLSYTKLFNRTRCQVIETPTPELGLIFAAAMVQLNKKPITQGHPKRVL